MSKSNFDNITVEPDNMGYSRGADVGSFAQPTPYVSKVAIVGEDEMPTPKTKQDILIRLSAIMLEDGKSMDYLNAIQRAIDIIKGK